MKTDRFDEEIRKKLEAVYQGASEQEVSRVFAKVSGYTVAMKMLRIKRALMYSSFTLLVTSLVYWGWIERATKISLQKQIIELQQQHLQKEPTTPHHPSSPPASNMGEKTAPINFENKIQHEPLRASDSKNESNKNSSEPLINKKDYKQIIPQQVVNLSEFNTLTKVDQLPLKYELVFHCFESSMDVVGEELPADLPDPSPRNPYTKTEKDPVFSTIVKHTRVYALGQIGTEHKAIVLGADYMIGTHWMVSTGVGLRSQQEGNYRDERQFEAHRGQRFRQVYGESIPQDSMPLMNIRIKNTMVQMPLMLSYQLPISKGFWLVSNLGTQLNISTRQNLHFIRAPRPIYPGGPFANPEGQYQTQVKIPLLNNAQIGFGVEKRWNKFAVLASAGLDWYWKNSVYINERMMPSVKLKVSYKLKS